MVTVQTSEDIAHLFVVIYYKQTYSVSRHKSIACAITDSMLTLTMTIDDKSAGWHAYCAALSLFQSAFLHYEKSFTEAGDAACLSMCVRPRMTSLRP